MQFHWGASRHESRLVEYAFHARTRTAAASRPVLSRSPTRILNCVFLQSFQFKCHGDSFSRRLSLCPHPHRSRARTRARTRHTSAATGRPLCGSLVTFLTLFSSGATGASCQRASLQAPAQLQTVSHNTGTYVNKYSHEQDLHRDIS